MLSKASPLSKATPHSQLALHLEAGVVNGEVVPGVLLSGPSALLLLGQGTMHLKVRTA